MRDNPDNKSLGNLVGIEADERGNPETLPQNKIAQQINRQVDKSKRSQKESEYTLQKYCLDDQIEEEETFGGALDKITDTVDINKVVDKLIGDVEGEIDDQMSNDNYREGSNSADHRETSNLVEARASRQILQRPCRVTVLSRKVIENQLLAEELPESPPTLDLYMLMLILTNTTEQLQAPQLIYKILRRQDKDLWLESIYRELRALLQNKTWEYIRRSDILPGHKILSSK
jgi:hypothetical protein